jgi:hypothetical protein
MAFDVAVENWLYIYESNVIEVFKGIIVTVNGELCESTYSCVPNMMQVLTP